MRDCLDLLVIVAVRRVMKIEILYLSEQKDEEDGRRKRRKPSGEPTTALSVTSMFLHTHAQRSIDRSLPTPSCA